MLTVPSTFALVKPGCCSFLILQDVYAMAGPLHCTPVLASCRERCRHEGKESHWFRWWFVVIIPSSFSWNVCMFFLKYQKKRKNHARTQNWRFIFQKKGIWSHFDTGNAWISQTFLWFAMKLTSSVDSLSESREWFFPLREMMHLPIPVLNLTSLSLDIWKKGKPFLGARSVQVLAESSPLSYKESI